MFAAISNSGTNNITVDASPKDNSDDTAVPAAESIQLAAFKSQAMDVNGG